MSTLLKKILGAGLVLLSPLIAVALPVGDTQGVVSAVRVKNVVNGVQSFEIWFSSTTNDRWGCIGSGGHVLVSDTSSGVSPDSYKQIFAVALAAQAAGKVLALDSAGTNPCVNVNIA